METYSDPLAHLSEDLVALFHAARRAAARRVRSLGWGLTVSAETWFAVHDPDNPTSYSVGKKAVARNVLADPDTRLWDATPILDEEATAAAKECATQLVALNGVNLPFYSPLGHGSLLEAESNEAVGFQNVAHASDQR